MPYIHISTNVPAPFCQEAFLHRQLAEAVGGGEYTMTHIQTACCLWLAGSDAPAAIAEVSLFGAFSRCEAATARITEILEHAFEIDPERIYVTYTAARSWGSGGQNLE